MGGERRAVARHSTNLTAKLYSSSAPTLPCVVLNMSERGARLQFPDIPPDHDNFMLIFDGTGWVRSGAVRWRRGDAVGIEFVEDVDDLLS